ncbi:unnamed protein product [Cunninghamella blakesleeana]
MVTPFPNDLNEILSTPSLLTTFESYLRQINAHHNLLFIEAISQLKCQQDTTMIEQAVYRIWKTFINVGSPLEIRIQHRDDIIRNLISSRYTILTVDSALSIFHKSELEIRDLLQVKLNEFIKTSHFSSQLTTTNVPTLSQKRVIVVGGGFVGFTVASILDPMPYFHVTLIDTKESFEYTPGVVKMLVRPEETSSLRVRHDAYVKNGRIIIGLADKIVNDATGILVNNEIINFDYLVIGTGSVYQSKLKSFDISALYRMSELKSEYLQLKQAKNVLIIGGGLVGCELASEIALHQFKNERYEKKKVTLVESHSTLVYRSPTERQQKAYDYLKKLGVDIILNEKIIDFNNKDEYHSTTSYLGSSGQIYSDFDKVYIATGTIPNSQLLKNSSHEENDYTFDTCLDFWDRICVKPTLQIDHFKYQHLFAGGDVTNSKEEKTGYAATLAGTCIARNICRLEKGKAPISQGDKGTIAAPHLPINGNEKNGGIGRQQLSSWKKTFSFLHPNWAALKHFDEKEFLQLVAGEANHPKYAMGQLPKKLTMKDTISPIHVNPTQTSLPLPSQQRRRRSTYGSASVKNLSGNDVLSHAADDSFINYHKTVLDQFSISSESTLSTLKHTISQASSDQNIYLNTIQHQSPPTFKKEHHTELS